MHGSRSVWIGVGVISTAICGTIAIRLIAPHRTAVPSLPPVADRSVTSPLNQAGGGAVASEAYEVYSGLYRETQNEGLAFAADSLTDIPQIDGSCLKPATREEQEMVEAFVNANKQSHRWNSRFSIPATYRLLSRSEAEVAQKCINRSERNTAGCAQYSTIQHVRYLGVPGFDHSHLRALVSVIKKCGPYCGSGGIFVAERAEGGWRREKPSELVSQCSWMY